MDRPLASRQRDRRGRGGVRVHIGGGRVRQGQARALRAAAQRHQLDGALARGEAVLALVGGVEGLGDHVRRGLGAGDAQLVRLPAIARVRRPGELAQASPRRAQFGDGALLQIGGGRAHRPVRVRAEGEQQAAPALDDLRGGGDADGGEDARVAGHEHARDAQFGGQLAGVERPRAAEGHEREPGGVVAAFEADAAQGARHRRVRHLDDGGGGLLRLAQRRQRLARAPQVGHDASPQGRVRPQPSEREVRVGDGRERPLSITGGAGIGARALRPHGERAAVIEPRDRAAARAHGHDVDHGRVHGEAVDLGGGAVARFARAEGGVGAGAAHVERDDAVVARRLRHGERPEHAARRSARDHRDGALAGGGGVREAARRVHHAQAGEARVDAAQVAARGGLEEGVDGGRAGALVLAVLGQGLVRGAHGEARRAQGRRQPRLVLGAQVGEEQADGDRLRAQRPRLPDGARDLGVVEGRHDRAVRADALAHGDDVAAGDDVGAAARFEVVERGALLPPDDEQVAEALGGDEDGARAAPFEQGVGGDGAAVREPPAREVARPGQHRLLRRGGRGEPLPRAHAALADGDEVRERAAHVHPQHLRPHVRHG